MPDKHVYFHDKQLYVDHETMTSPKFKELINAITELRDELCGSIVGDMYQNDGEIGRFIWIFEFPRELTADECEQLMLTKVGNKRWKEYYD